MVFKSLAWAVTAVTEEEPQDFTPLAATAATAVRADLQAPYLMGRSRRNKIDPSVFSHSAVAVMAEEVVIVMLPVVMRVQAAPAETAGAPQSQRVRKVILVPLVLIPMVFFPKALEVPAAAAEGALTSTSCGSMGRATGRCRRCPRGLRAQTFGTLTCARAA